MNLAESQAADHQAGSAGKRKRSSIWDKRRSSKLQVATCCTPELCCYRPAQ